MGSVALGRRHDSRSYGRTYRGRHLKSEPSARVDLRRGPRGRGESRIEHPRITRWPWRDRGPNTPGLDLAQRGFDSSACGRGGLPGRTQALIPAGTGMEFYRLIKIPEEVIERPAWGMAGIKGRRLSIPSAKSRGERSASPSGAPF